MSELDYVEDQIIMELSSLQAEVNEFSDIELINNILRKDQFKLNNIVPGNSFPAWDVARMIKDNHFMMTDKQRTSLQNVYAYAVWYSMEDIGDAPSKEQETMKKLKENSKLNSKKKKEIPNMKVYAIFSIAHTYDQPDNNLEKLYNAKPNFTQLVEFFFEQPIEELADEDILFIASILRGESALFRGDSYRLEEVEVEIVG